MRHSCLYVLSISKIICELYNYNLWWSDHYYNYDFYCRWLWQCCRLERCQCLYRIIVATINWLPPALHCFDPPVTHVAWCIVCHCRYVHPPGNLGSDFLGPVFPLRCFVCHYQNFLPLVNLTFDYLTPGFLWGLQFDSVSHFQEHFLGWLVQLSAHDIRLTGFISLLFLVFFNINDLLG